MGVVSRHARVPCAKIGADGYSHQVAHNCLSFQKSLVLSIVAVAAWAPWDSISRCPATAKAGTDWTNRLWVAPKVERNYNQQAKVSNHLVEVIRGCEQNKLLEIALYYLA
jgi:hypothetical protein